MKGTLGVERSPDDYVQTHYREFPGFKIGPLETAAAWTDLLGFGALLDERSWNLDEENIRLPFARLLRLTDEIRGRAQPGDEEGIFINDGVIRTCHPDLYQAAPSERHNFLTWLESCIVTHCNVTGLEQDYCLPGLRTVICQGQTALYSEAPTSKKIRDKSSDTIFHLASLQLNTALSKCYLAESGGSRIGLKRGGLYIEQSIVDTLINNFSCEIFENNMLFIYGFPLFPQTARYSQTKQLFRIPESLAEDHNAFHDRSSWMQLGDPINVVKGKLSFDLREVVAFSPLDECSLLWYDTFRGDMHGYLVSDMVVLGDNNSPLYDEITPKQIEQHGILKEFISMYWRYKYSHPNLPWKNRPHMQERDFKYEPI